MDAAGGMCLLVIEQPLGPDKARGCDHNQCQSDKDESEPVVAAEGPRQPFDYPLKVFGHFCLYKVVTKRRSVSVKNKST